MVNALTSLLAVAAGLLVVTCAVLFGLDRARPRPLDIAVYVLEGGLVLRAMIGLAQMISGDESSSVTHIGYLVATVAILPLVLNMLEGDRSRWSSAILGVAALVIVVVLLRLQATTG